MSNFSRVDIIDPRDDKKTTVKLKKWSWGKGLDILEQMGNAFEDLVETAAPSDGKIQTGALVGKIMRIAGSNRGLLSMMVRESMTAEGQKKYDDDVLSTLFMDDMIKLLTAVIELNTDDETMGNAGRLKNSAMKMLGLGQKKTGKKKDGQGEKSSA